MELSLVSYAECLSFTGFGILGYILRNVTRNATNGRIVGGSERVDDRINPIGFDASSPKIDLPELKVPSGIRAITCAAPIFRNSSR